MNPVRENKISPLNYSYRRRMIDEDLNKHSRSIKGTVVDVGGRKLKHKGFFRIPAEKIKEIITVNIEKNIGADIIASAEKIPLAADSAETVIMTEVLEHLQNPKEAIKEAARLLKPGGHIIISAPFLYPIHADPDDYQRLTASWFRQTLAENNLEIMEIKEQGFLFTVILDSLKKIISEIKFTPVRWMVALLFLPIAEIFLFWEKKFPPKAIKSYVGGYFIIARKS